MSYLLAWGPDLNLRDNDGYTPLHLAIKSVDQVESTRPARFLLIRGANKSVRDNNEDTPLDLINKGEVSTQRLANDLKNMLGDAKLFDCLMLSTPTRYVTRSHGTMLVYLSMMIAALVMMVLATFPCK